MYYINDVLYGIIFILLVAQIFLIRKISKNLRDLNRLFKDKESKE